MVPRQNSVGILLRLTHSVMNSPTGANNTGYVQIRYLLACVRSGLV